MDGSRFDDLARDLTTGARTRRNLIRGALAGLVGLALVAVGGEGAEARHKRACYTGYCRVGYYCCGRNRRGRGICCRR